METITVVAVLSAVSTALGVVLSVGNLQERVTRPQIELRLLQEGQKRLEVRLDRLENKIDGLREDGNERERKHHPGNN